MVCATALVGYLYGRHEVPLVILVDEGQGVEHRKDVDVLHERVEGSVVFHIGTMRA